MTNHNTTLRYERVGVILGKLSQQIEQTETEKLLLDDLLSVHRPLGNAIDLIKYIVARTDRGDPPPTADDIASDLSWSYNTVRPLLRSLEFGGLPFEIGCQSRRPGEGPSPKTYKLKLQESVLTTLLSEY